MKIILNISKKEIDGDINSVNSPITKALQRAGYKYLKSQNSQIYGIDNLIPVFYKKECQELFKKIFLMRESYIPKENFTFILIKNQF